MKRHSDFVHLHTHTQFSLLDGACHISRLFQLAEKERMPAVAITDHGNMFGAIEFYRKALAHGIKPIIGSEVYISPESRFEKSAQGIQEASFHLILLAKDTEGYKNLMKLITAGYLEGFYYRPRIDKDILKKHHKGLVCLSACLKGEIPHLIKNGQVEQAKNTAVFFKDLFGKDFYLEIQDNLIQDQIDVNRVLIDMGKQLDIPLVATNDVHYLKKEDAYAHEALMALQTQATLDDPNRMRLQTDEFYLKNAEQMKRKFGTECPEAIKNTIAITEKCNLELDFKKTHLPHYRPPAGKTREGYFRELVDEGLKRIYPEITDEIRDRVEHELKIIEKSGFISYFLIAWDFVHYAKGKGIPVGPGRGSAAGSVVSYALGITDIDPLKYDLLFERFLNPERISMPDIDIDFCYERRSEVIDYVVQKYSKDNVAQIITFGTLMAKGVIRDVGRVMSMSYSEVDRIAKMVPNDLNMTLQQALKSSPELKNLYETDQRVTQLIDTSMVLEGLSRHASTHAAGVVICEKPLTEYIPLIKMGDGQITTGYPMASLEKIGLLKMDFLGLRTLTVISETLKIIKKTIGVEFEIDKIPTDDEKTFRLLSNAESVGVFQVESSGMRDLLKKFKPEKFEDLIAILALFRPGPMGSGMLDDFITRKQGKVKIQYDHESLEPILKETYGIIVFQEQVMRIASTLAGFSLAQADSLRRAMSKKTPEVMVEARKHFIEGCLKKDISRRIADKVFSFIEYFAGYGFNKCVAGSTEIINADTGEYVKVEELFTKKDIINTFSCHEKTLKIIPQRMKDIVCNGIKKIYRLKTRTGKEIVVTNNHPFLTVSGWKELKDLKDGDMIATPRKIPLSPEYGMEEYKIISLAKLLSEGNLCHTSGLYFYSNSREEVDEFTANIERFEKTRARAYQRDDKYEVYVGTGQDTKFFKNQVPWNKRPSGQTATVQSRFSRCGARIWIEELGLSNKKAYEKFIPQEVYSLSTEKLALFFGKLWSGDGFIFGKSNSIPYYATSSKRMAKDVQNLLLRLDIISSVTKKEFKYKYKGITQKRYGYTVYLLGRESVERFSEKICQHVTGKADQISRLRDYYAHLPRDKESKDIIPQEIKNIIRKEKERVGKGWREIERESGVCTKELCGRLRPHKKGFKRSTVNRLASYFDSGELFKYAASDIYWDPIVSIEYVGMENTYDIEMEQTHNFIADGIIVHNSHSAAYAMISYRTAYLKANYPVEFMTALLTSEKDNTDKIAQYIEEANRMGIKILPPDVNESYSRFTIIKDKSEENKYGQSIRFGLSAVKNVGHGAIDSIIEARESEGKFSSLYQFCEHVNSRLVNRKVIESLIKCGAFDSTGLFRSQLMAILDRAMEVAGGIQKDRIGGQLSFFDTFEASGDFKKSFQEIPDIKEWPENQLLTFEKTLLGFYITKHPLTSFEKILRLYGSTSIMGLSNFKDGAIIHMGGILNKVKLTTTKKTGERMAIAQLEDLSGMVEVLVFPKAYNNIGRFFKADTMIFLKARVSLREEEPKLIAEDAFPLEEVQEKMTKSIGISIITSGLDKKTLDSLKFILSNHKGNIPAYIYFNTPEKKRVMMALSRDYSIKPSTELIDELEEILGEGSVSVKASHSNGR
ncbi:MAG: DNA polymerase III subunit alpha [Candidatus Omnitrophica bacterium]|nr:DNA polymerase III subunit alpha [Candidatus Omnitrophota bacterium]